MRWRLGLRLSVLAALFISLAWLMFVPGGSKSSLTTSLWSGYARALGYSNATLGDPIGTNAGGINQGKSTSNGANPPNQQGGGNAPPVTIQNITPIGTNWRVFGSSIYPSNSGIGGNAYSSGNFPGFIQQRLQMAVQAHLNTVRVVNFLDSPDVGNVYDGTVYANLNTLMSDAQADNLHVILDLSTFRNWLEDHGQNGYDPNLWQAFISYIIPHFAQNPALLMWSIAGEIDPGKLDGNSNDQLVNFYDKVSTQIASLDPAHSISAGGMLHFNDGTGLPLAQIWKLPHINVIAVHDYSAADTNGLGYVAGQAKQDGKPWLVEEFGLPQSDGDNQRAQGFITIYNAVLSNGGVGALFWNLGTEVTPNSFDVNPRTPQTWQTVINFAP